MRKILLLFLTGSVITLIFGPVTKAFGNEILVGPLSIAGTGFGNVNTILTMQALGTNMGSTESGCVGVSMSGKLNTTGPSVCEGNNHGGNEKPPAGFPHNQDFVVSNASAIGIVFNTDQPGGSEITLNNMVLDLFNSHGHVGFTSGNFVAPMNFASTSFETGIGKSGWLFELDTTQAAQAQLAINSGFDILGLSATASGVSGGPETFFLTPLAAVSEPSTLVLFGSGLCLLSTLWRRKMRGSLEI